VDLLGDGRLASIIAPLPAGSIIVRRGGCQPDRRQRVIVLRIGD